MNKEIPETRCDGFPFALAAENADGLESPSVTHIRNNASYLTVGTISDKLAQSGMFLIGTFANLILLAPFFLVLSLVLGYYHFKILNNFVVSVGITTFVLFLASLTFQVWNSIRKRKGFMPVGWWSRMIGRLMAVSLVALLLLSTNWAIELARDQLRSVQFDLMTMLGSIFAGLSSLSILRNFAPVAGRGHKIGIFLVALFGLFGMFALLATLTNFVVYGNALSLVRPWEFPFDWKEQRFSFWFLIGVGVIVIISMFLRRPNTKDWFYHCLSIVFLMILASSLFWSSEPSRSLGERSADASNKIGELSRPLSLIVSAPIAKTLPERESKIVERLRSQKQEIANFQEQPSPDVYPPGNWRNFLKPDRISAYGLVQKYLDNAVELTEMSAADQFGFRKEMAKLARHNLATRINAMEGVGDQLSSGRLNSHQLVQQKVAELFVKLQMEKGELKAIDTLGESDIKKFETAALGKLKEAKANSLWQAEFAEMTGRAEELNRTPSPLRTSSFYPGTMGLISQESTIEEYREAIHAAMFENFVSGLPPERLSVAHFEEVADRFPLFEMEISREIDRRDMKERSVDELHLIVQMSQQLSANSMIPDFDGHVPTMTKLYGSYLEFRNLPARSLGDSPDAVSRFKKIPETEIATELLVNRAIRLGDDEADAAIKSLGLIRDPVIKEGDSERVRLANYAVPSKEWFSPNDLLTLVSAKYAYDRAEPQKFAQLDLAVSKAAFGDFAALNSLEGLRQQMFDQSFGIKWLVFLFVAVLLATIGIVVIDPNWTSLHGFYRGRLANTFLILPSKSVVKTRLSELSPPGSVGPYLLVNTVINLQNSDDLALRDQKCDFFVFTREYCGGDRTGYSPTKVLEKSYPHLNLATAMTISAAAVSPNMGRSTNGITTWLMTLLNMRLGYWIPNPKFLPSPTLFPGVFEDEMKNQVKPRWKALNVQRESNAVKPDIDSVLLGLAFPGGGIRSATFNLGVSQAFHAAGIFTHFDYLSSVSGGGYVASGIGAAMAKRIDGGQDVSDNAAELSEIPKWRIPLATYAMEIFSQMDEVTPWINLSDGGHAENLAVIELLRRRCKVIVVGNAEADPKNPFDGVGKLIRLANLELGVDIDIDMSALKLNKDLVSKAHWAVGKIGYPNRDGMAQGEGTLIMLKSSLTGDEGEMINEYKARNSSFPLEPTTDQFFDVGQFEAYRVLGLHVANDFISTLAPKASSDEQETSLGDFKVFIAAIENLTKSRNGTS